jgi:phage baseplate assembly protein V
VDEVQDLRIGSSIEIALPEISGSLFNGEITAIEQHYQGGRGQTVHVRCYDKLHRLRKRQPVRTHVQITPAELARELVTDIGLTVEVDEDGPLTPYLLQYQQSDFDLLADLCRRSGLYLTLRGDLLHLVTLRGTGESIDLALGSTLLEARIELNAEAACRSITAKGWDVWKVEAHEARADDPRSGRDVSAEAPPDRFNASGERTLTDEVLPDDLHARAVAQGELDLRAAREVTIWGIAEGDVSLAPGARIDVSGVSDQFSGRYVLTSVSHRIDRRSGFVSEISTLPPRFKAEPKGATVVWGTVTSVEDPERMGRVRAKLPAFGEVETDWMSVMAAGAGASKGFVILPDVDDQVLVLFPGADMSQSIVLGGLYGLDGPTDYGVDGASVRRYFLGTPGGQRIKLDDSGECIRLENKGGSFVELAPEKFLLHSAVPLQIEAPGREVIITGKTIDFKQA